MKQKHICSSCQDALDLKGNPNKEKAPERIICQPNGYEVALSCSEKPCRYSLKEQKLWNKQRRKK